MFLISKLVGLYMQNKKDPRISLAQNGFQFENQNRHQTKMQTTVNPFKIKTLIFFETKFQNSQIWDSLFDIMNSLKKKNLEESKMSDRDRVENEFKTKKRIENE